MEKETNYQTIARRT